MPLGSARLTLFAKPTVAVEAEVIRKKVGVNAIGNAQVDTAISKFGGASLLLDGNVDYLDIDTITLGTEWTIEGWFRRDLTGVQDELFEFREGGNAPGVYYIGTDNKLTVFDGGTTKSTNTLNANTWYHIAFVSDPTGNTVKGYVDGVEWLSHAGANTISGVFCLIGINSGLTSGFDGYMDEIRFSTSQRYTTGFTAPTAPFVNDDDTLLLLHMNGTDGSTFFEDDNGTGRSAVGVSALGNAEVDTAQYKFGGASLYATQDGLIAKSILNLDGDFTIEGWMRRDVTTTPDHLFAVTTTGKLRLYADTGTSGISFWYDNSTTASISVTQSATTWYHYAVVRASNVIKVYVDGTQVGTTYSDSIDYSGEDFYIGSDGTPGGTGDLTGHIDEFRISDTARYTTGFTPPTAPFVNDDNTLLLLHMDGTDADTDFRDDNGVGRSAIGVSAIGDAQIDTAQSKFGGTSFLGDGTGDYLEVTNNGQFDFGTGDFTIEWFQYLTSLDRFSIDMRGGTNGSNILIYSFPTDGSAADLYLYVNSANRISASGVISANVWQHIALVRNSGTTRLYVDGTQAGSDYSDSTNYDNADMLIWENSLSAGNYTPPGHIDEFRMSDSARYTGAFTAPTEPFQNDANTLLLLHMDGTDGSTVFIDDNGKQA